MPPNPALKQLGYADDDRLVIIHQDDVGMCHASVQAFRELWSEGAISSGSLMVPCSWFPAAAAAARELDDVDLGVHATLTCEWDQYRWGPLSTRDATSGLLDAEGYFPRGNAEVHAQAQPTATIRELGAQVEHALRAGIVLTHLDTHMGTVLHPQLAQGYLETALQHGLVPMLLRCDEQEWIAAGADAEMAALAARYVCELEERGMPLIDHITGLPLDRADDPEERWGVLRYQFERLRAGITHLVVHASVDTPELRAIAPDWRCRRADHAVLMDQRVRAYLREQGIHVIGYRALQQLLPAS